MARSKSRLNRALGVFCLADGCIEETLRNWYQDFRNPDSSPVKAVIRLFGKTHPEAIFIQIGANDGMALDPLRTQVVCRRWKGVMVEPVPYVFERLRQRYVNHPRITLVNAAIADQEAMLPFYSLGELKPGEEVWGWYHALGSFRKDVVLKHQYLIPDIEKRIEEIQVRSMRFETLCAQTGITQIDLLQIDTEGYDYEIIRRIPFAQFKPKLIVYEHQHLSPEDRKACRDLLHQQGYLSFESGIDTAALHDQSTNSQDSALKDIFLQRSGNRSTQP